MKRTILFFLAALTLLVLLPLLPSRPDPAAEVLRLHILANSDSPQDQERQGGEEKQDRSFHGDSMASFARA